MSPPEAICISQYNNVQAAAAWSYTFATGNKTVDNHRYYPCHHGDYARLASTEDQCSPRNCARESTLTLQTLMDKHDVRAGALPAPARRDSLSSAHI